MRKVIVFLIICWFLSPTIYAQDLLGAWEGYHTTDGNENLRTVLIISENYQSRAVFNADTGAFVSTDGGPWKLDGNTLTETVEYNSANPEMVGKESSFEISLDGSTLEITGSGMEMKRVDNGTPGALQGAWLMSGRTVDGKKHLTDTDTPRK